MYVYVHIYIYIHICTPPTHPVCTAPSVNIKPDTLCPLGLVFSVQLRYSINFKKASETSISARGATSQTNNETSKR